MTRIVRATVPALLIAWLFAACGGGGGGGGGGNNPPPNQPPPPPQNPCSTATVADGALAAVQSAAGAATASRKRGPVVDTDVRWSVLDSIWSHRQGLARGLIGALAPMSVTEDIGNIAVLQDQGDLVLRPNLLDLRDLGLRFTGNGSGGYDVTRIDGTFRSPLGNRVTLGDDDTVETTAPFGFPFYGGTHTAMFVNSDGNITLGEGDSASAERDVSRLLTGPPRIAPFYSDLDPTAGTGRVFVRSAADAVTVTWCGVQAFDLPRLTTVQASLLPDGVVEMKFGSPINVTDAVVGLSPGHTGIFTPVDLSASGPTPGGAEAVGERFAQASSLDTVAVARKFYQSHPDVYDQLVIFTDSRVIRDAFAFEVTIANEIHGIGLDVYDTSRDFGSGGALRSMAVMDALTKYPNDPTQQFFGENSTLSILGQEVGHRWLAFVRFRDHTGRTSDALLGRDLAHWSFFMDSDASVMEGNDIEDQGGGSFRTVAAVSRYSALDQYMMGVLGETQVPPFFYVADPITTPLKIREDGPQVGFSFMGTRRNVLVQDVIAVEGPRSPTAARSPKVHRQAFLYVLEASPNADPGQVAKLDRIRREWEAFFLNATNGRMRAETRLRPSS